MNATEAEKDLVRLMDLHYERLAREADKWYPLPEMGSADYGECYTARLRLINVEIARLRDRIRFLEADAALTQMGIDQAAAGIPLGHAI